MPIKIQIRRDLSTSWSNINPVLSEGELGLETDTKKIKVGDGIGTEWNNLPYILDPGYSNLVSSSIILTIGPSGDYQTINGAIGYLSRHYPIYVNGGIDVDMLLLSGFVMEEQVLLRSLDLSWATIKGEDAETFVERDSLTTNFGGLFPVFGAMNGARLPKIDHQFSVNETGSHEDRAGVYCCVGSKAIILGGGVRKNVKFPLFASGSSLVEADAMTKPIDFSGTNVYYDGVDITHTCIMGIKNSIIHMNSIKAVGGSVNGTLSGGGSTIVALNSDCKMGSSESNNDIVVMNGSFITANGAIGGTSQQVNIPTADGIIFK
jgi:hypothetical protein